MKCDEAKPHCQKCISSGRKCEGPVTRQIRFVRDRAATPGIPVLVPEVSLLIPQHDTDERWAFDHFIHRPATVFAGEVDAAFWLELVPRLAQSQPFVWDTVVSISWLYEWEQHRRLSAASEADSSSTIATMHQRRALKLYTRALANFRQLLEQDQVDSPYALLSCILFTSVEFMQGNERNARGLMESGYRILNQSLCSSGTSPPYSAILEVVSTFFSRHAVVLATLSNPFPPEWNKPFDDDSSSSSSSDSSMLAVASEFDKFREQLYHLMYKAYRIVRVTMLFSQSEYEMERLKPKQQELVQEVEQWKERFVNLWSREKRPGSDWVSSKVLMQWGVCYIWLSCCTSPFQTAFDAHREDFAAIIDHAEELLHYMMDPSRGKELTFDPEIIPALYFSATKCRDPLLRRRALRLIRQAPQHESLWESISSERVVEKVIAIEEGHVQGCSCDLLASTDPSSLPLPPEGRRVHHIGITRQEAPGRSPSLALQLSKPAANAKGPTQMVHENVWLESDINCPIGPLVYGDSFQNRLRYRS